MQHLLERYPESTINDSRIMNTAEKRLVQAYYAAKNERLSLVGTAARYITIKYEDKKGYTPVFDPRFDREVEALHFRGLEIAKREEDLLLRIDQISGKFQFDIKGLHEEKLSLERQIERLNLFPVEQEKIRKQHADIVEQIAEYKKLLPEGI